jgi:hypothetical protein
VTNKGVEVEASDCADGSVGCRALALSWRPSGAGEQRFTIAAYTSAEPEPLPLLCSALVIGADTEVRDLGEVSSGDTARVSSAGDSYKVSRQEGARAAATASEDGETVAEPPPTDPRKARVKWTVVDEEGIYGYIVYRSERREGPFVRVNRDLIRSAGAGAGRHDYHFDDAEVLPGTTYYYFVDLVGTNGHRRRLTGVAAKTLPSDQGS